ncbi:class I SAM-dependent methyltransferase [Nocardia gipuzkoensis]
MYAKDSTEPVVEHGRALLFPEQLRDRASTACGYLDVLEPRRQHRHGRSERALGQATLETGLAAKAYERLRGPAGRITFWGLSPEKEREIIAGGLRLDSRCRVLDVGCGPGNFTKFVSDRLPVDGLAVGLDLSQTMVARAVEDNTGDRVVYLHADAHELPFSASTFDGVMCYAALYLMPQPYRVLDELVRVLSIGGRLTLMTTCVASTARMRLCQRLITRPLGIRQFTATEIVDYLQGTGLHDIEQRIHGMAQFVSATK